MCSKKIISSLLSPILDPELSQKLSFSPAFFYFTFSAITSLTDFGVLEGCSSYCSNDCPFAVFQSFTLLLRWSFPFHAPTVAFPFPLTSVIAWKYVVVHSWTIRFALPDLSSSEWHFVNQKTTFSGYSIL